MFPGKKSKFRSKSPLARSFGVRSKTLQAFLQETLFPGENSEGQKLFEVFVLGK